MAPISLLLIDDSATFLLLVVSRFLFEQHANEVVVVGTAHGGKEALARVHDLRPQVILLDLAMPDLHGLEVIPRLRTMLPAVGIIVLTLLDSNGYREAALEAGVDEFISKATLSTDLVPAPRDTRSRWPRLPRSRVPGP